MVQAAANPVDWVTIISVVASMTTLVSFFINLYQYFKLQSVRQGLDAIDRNVRAAMIEAMNLEQKAPSPEEKAKARVVTGMLVSILNITTTFMSYKRKQIEDASKNPPFISLGQ